MPKPTEASPAGIFAIQPELVHRVGFGGVLWLFAVWLLPWTLAEALLMLAPLVLVRPALALLDGSNAELPGWGLRVRRVALGGELPAAGLLALSWAWPTGAWAALLAVPWLGITGLLGLWGLARLAGGAGRTVAGLAPSIGMILVPIGGVWCLLSRWGQWPLDFSPIIVLLTGVHFHYAGLILPILIGQAAQRRPGRALAWIAAGILLGIPLLAAGITFSPVLEVAAAGVLVAACVALAGVQLTIAWGLSQPGCRSLLAGSAVALLVGMGLATLYAVGEYTGQGWIDIPTMIPLHGVANALGFALPGVWGYSLLARQPR